MFILTLRFIKHYIIESLSTNELPAEKEEELYRWAKTNQEIPDSIIPSPLVDGFPANLKTENYQHDDDKTFLIEENLKQSFKFLEQSESENDSTYYGDSIFPEKTSVGKQKSSISFISEISMKIKG